MQTHQAPFHIDRNAYASVKIAIVQARFNHDITQTLHRHSKETLLDHGVMPKHLIEMSVPGAVELPFAAQQAILTHQADAVIALGCVIQGATAHFDYVCSMCASGLMEVQLKHQKPVIFGVLTTETKEQAIQRATGSQSTGSSAALTALELISLSPANNL